MHFFAKCNSGRIAIQWFHIKHYLDYQYTQFQPYALRVQKMCVFARYATLVPRLYCGNCQFMCRVSVICDVIQKVQRLHDLIKTHGVRQTTFIRSTCNNIVNIKCILTSLHPNMFVKGYPLEAKTAPKN